MKKQSCPNALQHLMSLHTLVRSERPDVLKHVDEQIRVGRFDLPEKPQQIQALASATRVSVARGPRHRGTFPPMSYEIMRLPRACRTTPARSRRTVALDVDTPVFAACPPGTDEKYRGPARCTRDPNAAERANNEPWTSHAQSPATTFFLVVVAALLSRTPGRRAARRKFFRSRVAFTKRMDLPSVFVFDCGHRWESCVCISDLKGDVWGECRNE